MNTQEFRAELSKAFKTHMFMADRDKHTVNELLYVLEHHSGFNKEDFNITIMTTDKRCLCIPTLEAFVTTSDRGIWFNDVDVEFEIDAFEDEEYGNMSFNCITIYETK